MTRFWPRPPRHREAGRRAVSIETKEVRGVKTYHLQPRGPVALDPAWGIVDGRLVVTATYQGLKAHIARDGKKSLGKLPSVAARLQSGPIAISYQNTYSTLQQTITALQTLGPLVLGQLSQVGIHLEMPTLPDLEPLESHILPRINTTRRTKNGLESESYSTVPFAYRRGDPAATAQAASPAAGVQPAPPAWRSHRLTGKLRSVAARPVHTGGG